MNTIGFLKFQIAVPWPSFVLVKRCWIVRFLMQFIGNFETLRHFWRYHGLLENNPLKQSPTSQTKLPNYIYIYDAYATCLIHYILNSKGNSELQYTYYAESNGVLSTQFHSPLPGHHNSRSPSHRFHCSDNGTHYYSGQRQTFCGRILNNNYYSSKHRLYKSGQK